MKTPLSLFLLLTVLPISAFATDKGTCPPPPSAAAYSDAKKAAQIMRKGQGSVIGVLITISDTGYVCSAEVIKGLDKKTDAEAVKTVRQWHFDPAKKDGRPVPVVTVVQVNYHLDKDGHIIVEPWQPTM